MKEQAKQLLDSLDYCIISSIGPKGNPQSALVAFSANDNFEIMIGTSKKSRKFQNILRNPNVSIVFGPVGKHAIQYEGTARTMEGEELVKRKAIHLKRMPGSEKYEADPDQTYFVVEPRWMRLVQSGPDTINELEFHQ